MKLGLTLVTALVIALIGIFVFLPAHNVLADAPAGYTKYWDGGPSGSWDNATNWDNNTLPGVNDKVYIGAGDNITFSTTSSVAWIHSDRPFIMSGGSLTLTDNSTASIFQSSFILSGGTIRGEDNITINGLFHWSAGTFDNPPGTLTARGGITMDTAGSKNLESWTLNNDDNGVANYIGSGLTGYNATINNKAGSTFNITSDSAISTSFSGRFNNYGTFNRTTSTGTATINVGLNNSGTVNIQSGTLSVRGGNDNSTGAFTVLAGASLSFDDGTHLLSGATISGAGNVNYKTYVTSNGSALGKAIIPTNGNVTFSGTPSIADSLELSGGALYGTGSIAVNGLFHWSSGTLGNPPGTITAKGGITIDTASSKNMESWTLNNDNNGVANYIGSGLTGYNATINNKAGSTFNITSDSAIATSFSGVFNNYGTLNRTSTTGTATFNIAFNNSDNVTVQSGILSLQGTFTQISGQTQLNGGSLITSQPLNIQGGSLTGNGTINGEVKIASPTGTGLVSPGLSAGSLNITGNYTQGSGGDLKIEIGGNTTDKYDNLTIGGIASFAGSLTVELIDGFTPAAGNSFTIMTFASKTGSFATTNLPVLSSGLKWNVVPSDTNVILSVSKIATPGVVMTWGKNTYSQLGNGNTTHSTLPVYANISKDVTAVSSGDGFSLALNQMALFGPGVETMQGSLVITLPLIAQLQCRWSRLAWLV